MGALPPAVLEELAGVLGDDDEWVRRNAALGLARLGPAAEAVQPAVVAALDDPNRYVSAKAAKTLERIGTPEATEICLTICSPPAGAPSPPRIRRIKK